MSLFSFISAKLNTPLSFIFRLLARSQFSVVCSEVVEDGFGAIGRPVDLDSDRIADSTFVLLQDDHVDAVDDCMMHIASRIMHSLVGQVYNFGVILLLRRPLVIRLTMCAWIWPIFRWLIGCKSLKLVLLDQT